MRFRSIMRQSAASLLVSNGVYGYTFLCNVLLMRMLLPEDFGTVALAASLFGLIEIFTTFSFNAVLVQHRDTPSALRAIFQSALAVIGLKILLATIFYLAIRGQYSVVVWQLFALMMASKMFAGIGPLMVARLEKGGDFLRATLVSTGANAVAVSMAVVAVWLGAGVYGLSLRVVLPPVLVFLAMIACYPDLFPRGLRQIRRRQLRVVAAASTRLYFQRGAEMAYMRVPLLIVEALFGPVVLGLLSQATYLVTLLNRITSIMNHQIAFVFFARNRRDAAETRHGYLWLLGLNAAAAVPVVLLMGIFPEQIVMFLWGEEWLGVVPFVRVMAMMALLLPIFALLKSRLLGLRRNGAITLAYLAGLGIFGLGLLLMPTGFEQSWWIAGLSVLSYVVMVVLLLVLLRQADTEPAVDARAS